jgi:hypothetical protein
MKQLVCNQQTGRPCWAGGMWVIRRVYCVSELWERERGVRWLRLAARWLVRAAKTKTFTWLHSRRIDQRRGGRNLWAQDGAFDLRRLHHAGELHLRVGHLRLSPPRRDGFVRRSFQGNCRKRYVTSSYSRWPHLIHSFIVYCFFFLFSLFVSPIFPPLNKQTNKQEQNSMNANWLPVSGNDVPEPRPGQCVNDSRTLPEVTLNFIKSHSLMDESVPAFYGLPLVTHTSLK